MSPNFWKSIQIIHFLFRYNNIFHGITNKVMVFNYFQSNTVLKLLIIVNNNVMCNIVNIPLFLHLKDTDIATHGYNFMLFHTV